MQIGISGFLLSHLELLQWAVVARGCGNHIIKCNYLVKIHILTHYLATNISSLLL